MKPKTFTIGKYQAIVSIRDGGGNNQPYYPLTCLLTHIPTNTEKYVIEHKTVSGLCYQLHKYILEQYEEANGADYNTPYSPMLVFLGVEGVRDYMELLVFNMETKLNKEFEDFAKSFAKDDWLLK